jgi:hypothetical protein
MTWLFDKIYSLPTFAAVPIALVVLIVGGTCAVILTVALLAIFPGVSIHLGLGHDPDPHGIGGHMAQHGACTDGTPQPGEIECPDICELRRCTAEFRFHLLSGPRVVMRLAHPNPEERAHDCVAVPVSHREYVTPKDRCPSTRSAVARYLDEEPPITADANPASRPKDKSSRSQREPTPRKQPDRPKRRPTRQSGHRTCFPEVKLPTVDLPEVHIPAQTIPGYTIDGHRYPARRLPARTIPGRTIPGRTIQGRCYDVDPRFALSETTIRTTDYDEIDSEFSPSLTDDYWASDDAVSIPDPTASGFGEFNDAGFPKNQYVRPYVRRDGTRVDGYWRNSPSDGLPTCQVISC